MIYIFDLDFTLLDISHRNHFILNVDKKDWKGFNAACIYDQPIEHMRTLFNQIISIPTNEVYIYSGRNAVIFKETLETLKKLDFHIDNVKKIRLRPKTDRKHDQELKYKWFCEDFTPNPIQPILIFEDRKSVVDMWRKIPNVMCCEVQESHF